MHRTRASGGEQHGRSTGIHQKGPPERHSPIALRETSNRQYKRTCGQRKGREPGWDTHGEARGWLGHARSRVPGKPGEEQGALVTGQAQEGLAGHVLALGGENVEGLT